MTGLILSIVTAVFASGESPLSSPQQAGGYPAEHLYEFETCQINPHHFNHHKHMTVAMCYLKDFSEAGAVQKIRHGLIALLQHHGASEEKIRGLYNETITLFWVKLLDHISKSLGRKESLYSKINWAIKHYGTMEPVFKHYSRDLVFSIQAKQNWIEPDLAPLPF